VGWALFFHIVSINHFVFLFLTIRQNSNYVKVCGQAQCRKTRKMQYATSRIPQAPTLNGPGHRQCDEGLLRAANQMKLNLISSRSMAATCYPLPEGRTVRIDRDFAPSNFRIATDCLYRSHYRVVKSGRLNWGRCEQVKGCTSLAPRADQLQHRD
jgi:hypothetical protein